MFSAKIGELVNTLQNWPPGAYHGGPHPWFPWAAVTAASHSILPLAARPRCRHICPGHIPVKHTPPSPAMVSPCTLAAAAVLVATKQYYTLMCTLELLDSLQTDNVYTPALFGGAPCGIACATTDMDTIGTGALSPTNALYSAEVAANTLEAIVGYKHCRCRVKAGVFNLACDCTLWEGLRDKRSGAPPSAAAFAAFEANLAAAAEAAAAVRSEAATRRELALYELARLCPPAAKEGSNGCPSLAARPTLEETALRAE